MPVEFDELKTVSGDVSGTVLGRIRFRWQNYHLAKPKKGDVPKPWNAAHTALQSQLLLLHKYEAAVSIAFHQQA